MTSDAVVALVVGALLPMLISVVVRSAWPGWLKGAVAVGSSIVAGAVTAWATGQLSSAQGLMQTVVIIFGASMTTYKMFWQPTGIGPAVERATQPAAARPASPSAVTGAP